MRSSSLAMDGAVLITGVIHGQQRQSLREHMPTLHHIKEKVQLQQRPSAADLPTMVPALHQPTLNMTLLLAPNLMSSAGNNSAGGSMGKQLDNKICAVDAK
eukprot:7410023-Karenia_brevis.AAC.1